MNVSSTLNKKRKIPLEEMTAFYEKRFDLPVLHDTAIKKGVFMTFEDFKKNKPLEVRFRLSRDNWTDELYISGKNGENIVPEFWGVCDGTKLFIHAGYNVYPAIRQQNSFEVFGAKYISNNHDQSSNSLYNSQRVGPLSRSKLSIDETILQMDMDEGFFY